MANVPGRKAATAREVLIGAGLALILIFAISAGISQCGKTAEDRWTHETFWVLHRKGTLAVGDPRRPPGEDPAGDEWVKPTVLRCGQDGTEFVGYHTRFPKSSSVGLRMLQFALPGGPWYDEEDPKAIGIQESVKCPQCGAGGAFEAVTPQSAKRIWPPRED